MSAGRVRQDLEGWRLAHPRLAGSLDEEALSYGDYHLARYGRLMGEIDRLLAACGAPAVLDVGPNLQTALIRSRHPHAVVDTLGFAHPATPPRDRERHIEFDLNDAVSAQGRPDLERAYDVIVLGEVIEHLYTPPSVVLGWLGASLGPEGAMVIQTPNGAALHKRLRLLAGRSPVEPPRASRENPGHLHEYTLAELRRELAAAGLLVERLTVENHFGATGPAGLAYRAVGRLLPPGLRHGVTLCARRPR